MNYEARIRSLDLIQSLLECARRGVPGPVIVDNKCSCGMVHALTLAEYEDDAIEDAFRCWYEDPTNKSLVDVHVLVG